MLGLRDNLYVLRVLQSSQYFDVDDDIAFRLLTCARCGGSQLGVVAYVLGTGIAWFRCVSCGAPACTINGTVFPAPKPLRSPRGVPDDEAAVWDEARVCLQVGAYTGAVMLCRKLLFHVAVTHDLPAKNEKDRAPNFYECVEHLQSQGLITPKMRPWVDRIKDVGNEINHELEPIDPERALDVATFTQQLLVLAYEMDAMQGDVGPA